MLFGLLWIVGVLIILKEKYSIILFFTYANKSQSIKCMYLISSKITLFLLYDYFVIFINSGISNHFDLECLVNMDRPFIFVQKILFLLYSKLELIKNTYLILDAFNAKFYSKCNVFIKNELRN